MTDRWIDRWHDVLFRTSVVLNVLLLFALVWPRVDVRLRAMLAAERPRWCRHCEAEGRPASPMRFWTSTDDAAGNNVTGYWCPACQAIRWENDAGDQVQEPRAWSSNITPDPDTGLPAGMTFDEIESAMRTGVDRDHVVPLVPSAASNYRALNSRKPRPTSPSRRRSATDN